MSERMTSGEAPDEYTVVFHSDTPLATTLFDLLSVYIVPKHIWEGVTPEGFLTFANPNPVGTGPFKLDHWTKQQELC